MRTLVLADIHANIEALEAVLADVEHGRIDRVFVLGDLVGYGGSPADVIARILALSPAAMVRGNHDKVCAGLDSPESFNATARRAIEWTRRQLSVEDLTVLAELVEGPLLVEPEIEICHGAPFDEDYYVVDTVDAVRALSTAGAPLCLNGHTHVPAVFRTRGLTVVDETPFEGVERTVPLAGRGKVLVNVGSVGQPRDGDPRAAYGVIDAARGLIELRRVEYDILGAQQKILDAGLPASLAARLARGV